MKTLVVFNLIGKDNILLLSSGMPIIFSWNGHNDIFTEMIHNNDFKQLIYKNCINTDQYSYAKLSYFTLDVNSEKYEEKTVKIQDTYDIGSLGEISNKLVFDYIYNVLTNVLKYSSNETYKCENNMPTIDIIFNIYSKIKKNIGESLSDYSLRQYLISELQSKYRLLSKNISYIMKTYDDIVK